MPFINLKTNIEIKNKNKLRKDLGELIAIIPSKTVDRTMVCIEEKMDLIFADSDKPCALVETLVNKETDHSKDNEYHEAMIQLITKELDIEDKRIYSLIDSEQSWYSHK